jgi:hypothetical protein
MSSKNKIWIWIGVNAKPETLHVLNTSTCVEIQLRSYQSLVRSHAHGDDTNEDHNTSTAYFDQASGSNRMLCPFVTPSTGSVKNNTRRYTFGQMHKIFWRENDHHLINSSAFCCFFYLIIVKALKVR